MSNSEERCKSVLTTNSQNDTSIVNNENEIPEESKAEVDNHSQITTSMSYRLKLTKTCFMFLAYLGMGCSVGVLSPTSVDMSELYGCSIQSFVSVTSIKPLGILSGSITGALAADRFKSRADLSVFICTFINGITLAAMPWTPSLIGMGMVIFINGICLGTFNIVCNFLNLHMWGDTAPTALHLSHMFLTMGMAIAPPITIPFLSPHSINSTDVSQNTTTYEGHVRIPYAIFGAWSVMVAVIFLLFFIISRSYTSEKKSSIKDMFTFGSYTRQHMKFVVCFVICLFVMYFFVSGRDRSMSMFLFIIAHTDVLHMSKAASAGLVTIGIVSVTVGRGVAGVLSRWIDTRLLLLVQLVLGCYIQMLLMFYGLTSTVWLWTLTCLFGIVTGPTYPSILAWSRRYFEPSGIVLAVIDIGCGLGSCISLFVNGHLYDTYGSMGVFTLGLIYGTVILFIFVPLQITALLNGDLKSNLQPDLM